MPRDRRTGGRCGPSPWPTPGKAGRSGKSQRWHPLGGPAHRDAHLGASEEADGAVAQDDGIPHDTPVRHGPHRLPGGLGAGSELQKEVCVCVCV